jgi:menaquinone-dependent protoporphyrinogen oxidase
MRVAASAQPPGLVGALRYTQYGSFKRLIMKLLARQHGSDTGTTHDHEHTDRIDLTRFVEELLAAVPPMASAH